MCDTCGCNNSKKYKIINYDPKDQGNMNMNFKDDVRDSHHHDRTHENDTSSEKKIIVEQDILYKNNLIAQRNRGYFDAKNICVFNILGSPGCGKTTFLENTIEKFKEKYNIYVIEGDQYSNIDAKRIKKSGAEVVQINTGNGCHLNAEMIQNSLKEINPEENSLLFIENVGNLICPSLFDLGEDFRIVLLSVTEGEDKPIKYLNIFETSHVCIINKIDLLPYIKFDINILKNNINKANHHLEIFEISALNHDSMVNWYQWLENKRSDKK